MTVVAFGDGDGNSWDRYVGEPSDRVVVDTIAVTHGAPAIARTPTEALCGLGDDIVSPGCSPT